MHSRCQIKCPDNAAIQNCQVCNKLPVLFPQDRVGANNVDNGGAGRHGVYHLEMHGAAPAELLMTTVDLLLLVPEHEPVKTDADEVHHYRKRVEHVMPRLNVNCPVLCLQRVLTKVSLIRGCLNACNDGQCRYDEGPISEWNEKSVQVHV